MRRFLSMVLAVAVFGVASWAWAMPAPKSEEELDALADIIVDAEVVSVECVGVLEVPGELKQAKFRSTHQLLASHYGDAPDTFHIDFFVDLMEVPIAACSWREPPHWVGEESKLWLHEASEAGDVYVMFDWSGIQYLDDSAPVAPTDEEMASCTATPDPVIAPDPVIDPDPLAETDDGEAGCAIATNASTGSALLMVLALMGLLAGRARRSGSWL